MGEIAPAIECAQVGARWQTPQRRAPRPARSRRHGTDNPPGDASSVAYVIASHGTEELARAAYGSIADQYPAASVVIVSDPDSTGYSATLNRGVQALQSERPEVICCLNADVKMIESDQGVRDLFTADPHVAIIGPRQVNADDRIVHGGIVPHVDGGTPWDVDLRQRYWFAWTGRADVVAGTSGTFEVPTVAGSVFYIRRKVLDALGGWPEWTRFYYEDTYLCYAARAAGHRVLYTGATTWLHLHEQGSVITRSDRIGRLAAARERFVYECGRAGVHLNFQEEIV